MVHMLCDTLKNGGRANSATARLGDRLNGSEKINCLTLGEL